MISNKPKIFGWNLLRITHFVLGIVSCFGAFMASQNIFLYILGLGFIIQSTLNIACSKDQYTSEIPKGKYKRKH